MVKKKPKFGALPVLNMPTRRHDIAPKQTRAARSIVNVTMSLQLSQTPNATKASGIYATELKH